MAVVRDPLNPPNVRERSVIVTPFSVPQLAVVLCQASAIITEKGGITSHAAIIARECLIPCIVGLDGATRILRDGMMVRVNGSAGIVELL